MARAGRYRQSPRTVAMDALQLLKRGICVGALLMISTLGFGQDAPETPAPNGQAGVGAPQPNGEDSEIAAEVQRLRIDLDRLQRQVTYLTNLIEQMESERPAIERLPAKPAAKSSNSKKKSATVADAASAPITPDADEKVTKTVLVFRDGHKMEATNYAIVGQSLWIYTDQDSKKVPLSDLDVTATKNANSDRGVIFQVPPTK
jgi:hypothetical protein